MSSAPLVGIDFVEPARLAERLRARAGLAQELFHPGELSYCEAQPHPDEHLAARFAAKEAVIKALSIDGFEPLDIEILGGGESCDVLLHADAALRAAELGVVVTISMTHLA